MPLLQIRDLPQEVYRKLAESAKREHRSLSQQATALLSRALDADIAPRERRRMLLDRLAAEPLVRDLASIPPAEALIREDRER